MQPSSSAHPTTLSKSQSVSTNSQDRMTPKQPGPDEKQVPASSANDKSSPNQAPNVQLQTAQQQSSPQMLEKKDERTSPNSIIVSGDMFDFDGEVEKLIRSIWNYIYSYTDSPAMQYNPQVVLAVLRKSIEIFQSEPVVLDLKKVVCIMGDIMGQGDTLISLLSTIDLPPQNTFLFLGNYAGQGFAPHEVFLLLLALKVRYPNHVYLLKGNMEDSEVLKANDFIEGLVLRNLMQTSMVWLHFEQVLDLLPWAAVLDNNYFCTHGGIGPQLLKHGLKGLRKCRKPASYPLELALEQECMWSCYRGSLIKASDFSPDSQPSYSDGSPLFGDSDIEQFLAENNLKMMIRSRQVVMDGILNHPPLMLTIWSAAAYLDNFRNMAVLLVIDGERNKAAINRLSVSEDNPKSLDDFKPQAGRNAIILA